VCPPVEIGGALQPVDRLSDGSCPNCFPAGATATLRDGSTKVLSGLVVGDEVQVCFWLCVAVSHTTLSMTTRGFLG